MNTFCAKKRKSKWTEEILMFEANKYSNRWDFQKGSYAAYQAANRLKILNKICGHMNTSKTEKYSFDELAYEASKYNKRTEFFQNNGGAYRTAISRGILDKICYHMEDSAVEPWAIDELVSEALKYNSRNEFRENSYGAYQAACRRKVIDNICLHMKTPKGTSVPEIEIFELIKIKFPSLKKLRDKKVEIIGKPYIHGFDIDLFVPELNKGIEFDGKYYHSLDGLKRSKPKWPVKEIVNYHQIKDEYFKTKCIQILHVKEEDWIKSKEDCIVLIFDFLIR